MPGQAKTHTSQQQVIEEFRTNAGRVGGYFADKPLLLLGTTGARSGQPRTSALAYLADGDQYVVVAARAGAPQHPDWYHNLVAHPEATIEVGIEKFDVTAKILTGEERDAVFKRFTAQSPQVALYQASTSRQFPVIVLVPCDPGGACDPSPAS